MINLNFTVYLNIILKYVCFHSRGSGTLENGANNSGGLESHAIANFIQNIRQFILWGGGSERSREESSQEFRLYTTTGTSCTWRNVFP